MPRLFLSPSLLLKGGRLYPSTSAEGMSPFWPDLTTGKERALLFLSRSLMSGYRFLHQHTSNSGLISLYQHYLGAGRHQVNSPEFKVKNHLGYNRGRSFLGRELYYISFLFPGLKFSPSQNSNPSKGITADDMNTNYSIVCEDLP